MKKRKQRTYQLFREFWPILRDSSANLDKDMRWILTDRLWENLNSSGSDMSWIIRIYLKEYDYDNL